MKQPIECHGGLIEKPHSLGLSANAELARYWCSL